MNEVLEFLKKQGVENIVCSPGGRCKVLLQAFVKDKSFKVTTLYDERSASFYALGLSFDKPTVVLTTSGTAVTQLTSAMAEAYYQKDSKLIAVTADRPLKLRHTGAPQSLNQNNVFKNFARAFVDLLEDCDPLKSCELLYPMHVNVCLDEVSKVKVSKKRLGSLVVVSELNKEEQIKVKESLRGYDGCLVLEPLSNLQAEEFPKAQVIYFSESFVLKQGLHSFSSLIRLGGVPVFKPWRQIDSDIASYYWSEASEFSGGYAVKSIELKDMPKYFKTENLTEEIKTHRDFVCQLLEKYPYSEVSYLDKLATFIGAEDEVFIGNSMPIREWDFVKNKNYRILGQRGVNGIDGSLSLALGRMSPEKTSWIVLGDLTTLYNFNDFQLLEKLKDRKIRIVVVNNGGGQIFKRVIKKNTDYFLNTHDKSFKDIAKFWSLKYQKNEFEFSADQLLLEIVPNSEESEAFWKGLNS